MVKATAGKFSHEAGEPWTLGAFVEPLGAFAAVFFVAALGLAHPDSLWARWFYGPSRVAKAQERYPEDVELGGPAAHE